MLGFLIKRLAALFGVLFVVISITFLLLQIAPGSPFAGEKNVSPAVTEQLKAHYGLEGSVGERYVRYLGRLLQGDLGPSIRYKNRSVNEILAQSLPVTFAVGSAAFLIAITAGVSLGAFAAVRHNRPEDTAAMLAALFAISIPTFVTGPALVLIFALQLGVLPVGGWGTAQSLVLPSITLAAPFVAYIARLTRTSMLDVLNQDFVRTARAKGLPNLRVIYKHALKVGILPVVSFLGPLAANLLTGSLVIEKIYAIPGTGEFFVNSVLNKDAFLLGGVVIVYCSLLVLLNLVVDVVYTVLDRRIKLYD